MSLDEKTSGKDVTAKTYQQLKNKAVFMLSRREYSSQELRTKLLQSCSEDDASELVERVLEELQRLNYQDDLRFTAAFVRSKSLSSNGPIKIFRALSMKGIGRELAEQVVADEEIDFFELAAELMNKKFSLEQVQDYKQSQKCFRYMANRGFTVDQIKYAKEQLLSDD